MGSSRQQALLTHVIIGVVNVVTTLVAVFTVDSIGRWACAWHPTAANTLNKFDSSVQQLIRLSAFMGTQTQPHVLWQSCFHDVHTTEAPHAHPVQILTPC